MKTHRIAALLLAGVMLTAAGCGESSVLEISEDALPYGATLAKKITPGAPTLQYDSRYVPEECLDVVLKYYDCIEKNDLAEFQSIQIPFYHDYQLEKVLEGKYTDEEILTNTFDGLKEHFGGAFRFSMIDITDCVKKKPQSDLDELVGMMDAVWTDNGNSGKFSDDLSDIRALTVTRYLAAANSDEKGETGCALTGETLYVLNYQSQWYVIYN